MIVQPMSHDLVEQRGGILIADRIGMALHHFMRLFKARTGMTMLQYRRAQGATR